MIVDKELRASPSCGAFYLNKRDIPSFTKKTKIAISIIM
nr:MAG TPA: hypothetical protein [Caudoviricetes sp.]